MDRMHWLDALSARWAVGRQPRFFEDGWGSSAVLDKLTKDNKKHQGATAAREIEVRNSSMGISSSTSRARGVQASPLRWSQD